MNTTSTGYGCLYLNLCSDNGVKCETCANNPKRSYYRPVEPYYPWYPYQPYYPKGWEPWRITWTSGTAEDSAGSNTTYYQST